MIATRTEHEFTPYREDPSYGTGAVIDDSKGFRIRTRGAKGEGSIEHDYECPVHGRFSAMVPRAEVPDFVECSARRDDSPVILTSFGMLSLLGECCMKSPWRASTFATGISSGSVRR